MKKTSHILLGLLIPIVVVFGFLSASVLVNYFDSSSSLIISAHAQSQLPDYSEDGSGGFVPCGNKATEPCNISHLFRAFVVIVNYMITMAGFVAVAAIVLAGFSMVASQGVEGKVTAAKQRLSGAIIGMVLVAISFVLVNSLFAGSLSIGVIDGAKVLTSPLDYIKQGNGSPTTTTTPTNNPPTTNPPVNGKTGP